MSQNLFLEWFDWTEKNKCWVKWTFNLQNLRKIRIFMAILC